MQGTHPGTISNMPKCRHHPNKQTITHMFISAGLISALSKLAAIYGPQLVERAVDLAIDYVKSRITG